MRKKIILFYILIIFTIFGCSTFPINKILGIQAIPEPASKGSSAIAIRIDQNFDDGISRFKLKVSKVFIIKMKNENDSLKQRKIFLTNYYHASFMTGFQADPIDTFLLNIEPGFYAAVGAVADSVIIYFPEDVIKASIVEVKYGQMTYMGEYKLQNIAHDYRYFPDDLQNYYYTNQLFAKYKDDQGNMMFYEGERRSHHAPKAEKLMHSNEDEISYLAKYLSIFKSSGWDAKIDSRLNQLRQ